jgi:hypothetical protein
MKKRIAFLSIVLIFLSCSTKKAFHEAQQVNTIEAYEHFLGENPESKFSQEAQQQLYELKQEKAYNDAISQYTIESLNNYLSVYPNGAHKAEVEKILEKLEEDRDWQQALYRNTIEEFELFISNYPQSDYKTLAEVKVYDLKLEHAWSNVKGTETIKDVQSFRNNYPDSRYDKDVTNLIEYLDTYHREWENITESPSVEMIQAFIDQYSGMELTVQAEQKLVELDETAWQKATGEDHIIGYEEYLEMLPEGLHADEAEKRIIDLEVKKVFGGKYGSMPPMDRVSTFGYSNTNDIEIFNNTSYTLTILYSGPNSKRIDIQQKNRMSFALPNGKYKVAAWVSNPGIGKFAGTENLEGGRYSVEYYIRTSYY